MKQKILIPFLVLLFAFSAYMVATNYQDRTAVEVTAQVSLEHKEAYKVDDAEYKCAVADKIDFGKGEMVEAGAGLFSLLLSFSLFLKRNSVPIGISALALVSIFVGDSDMAYAALPLIPFYRSPDEGGGNGEIEKLIKGMAEKNTEAIKTQIELATKGIITTEVLTKRLEEVGLKDSIIETLTKASEEQGIALRKMQLDNAGKGVKDIDQLVEEKAEEIKALASGGDTSKRFKMKVSNKTMASSSSVTGSTLSYREQGIGMLAAPMPVFENVFRTVSLSEADLAASNGVITYLDVTAETNNAAETAESTGNTVGIGNKPESAITWQEYSAALRVIADTIPVTRNAYRHLGFIKGEIDRLLRKNQALRKDLQIYKGDGNAPNLKGIYTYTTAVVLASMPRYQNVVVPNISDLAMDLAVYVSNKSDASGAQSKYNPNALFINPADALRFFVKDSDGQYVLPPYMQTSGKVGNLQIIESPRVTVNTLMVGDASYGTIYQSEDVIIEMGLVNDQFLKNQWTIRAEQELCFLQRNADLGAFVKVTDITAAIEALAKP